MRSIKVSAIVFCIIIGLNLVHWSEHCAHAEDQPTQLQGLAKVVGVEANVQQAKAATEIKPTEVINKTLSMVKGAISGVADAIAKVAPHVWRIMVKQQYIKAITEVILPWSLFVMTIIAYFWQKKVWSLEKVKTSGEEGYHWFFQYIAPCVLWVIFAIWGCIEISSSVAFILNPEYYAIRDLMLMALNPSSISQ